MLVSNCKHSCIQQPWPWLVFYDQKPFFFASYSLVSLFGLDLLAHCTFANIQDLGLGASALRPAPVWDEYADPRTLSDPRVHLSAL
jgi:hypothetical protein